MRFTGLIVALILSTLPAAAGENWPEFRGPTADGHSDSMGLPLRWSATENVAWKTPIHDRGWSSPVIFDGQIWLTTATADGRELFAVCVDCKTGKIVHDVKVFDVESPERIAPVNSYASPTPAIERGRVYVHYGTYGTACLDTATGKTVWSRRDLTCDHHMGPGSSPILHGGLLIFHVDAIDVQYVVALDKTTGETKWKTDRSIDYSRIHRYTRKGFCTPRVIEVGGRAEMISPCSRAVFAYDPATGEELWKVRTSGWSMVARPLFGHGLVFAVVDYDHPQLWAIRPDGRGDVTEEKVVWRLDSGVPSTPSLLLIDDVLMMVSDDGIVSCVEAKTGDVVWKERLGGNFSAAPIYADRRVYLFSQEGKTTVLRPGRRFDVLAENDLDGQQLMASPAVSGKAIFVRTRTDLYRIEESHKAATGGRAVEDDVPIRRSAIPVSPQSN